jgi:hypothetical protein
MRAASTDDPSWTIVEDDDCHFIIRLQTREKRRESSARQFPAIRFRRHAPADIEHDRDAHWNPVLRELRNRPADIVFENLEIGRRQPAHEAARSIGNSRGDDDKIGAASERRFLSVNE